MKINITRGLVKLSSVKIGSLFMYQNTIAIKTAYFSRHGDEKRYICYVVGTGEMLWDGEENEKDWNNTYVAPLQITY